MAIPLPTTTITVHGLLLTGDPNAEGYDAVTPSRVLIASGVNACISRPIGSRSNPTDEIDTYTLSCDLFSGDFQRNYLVVDDNSGQEYDVETVAISPNTLFGLEHYTAKLTVSKGIC